MKILIEESVLRQALEAIGAALSDDKPYPQYKGITFYAGVCNTQQSSGNCYGDGTVYRGERSKDSEVPTYEMTAHEYKTLWYAAVADIEKIDHIASELQDTCHKQAQMIAACLSALQHFEHYGYDKKLCRAAIEKLSDVWDMK